MNLPRIIKRNVSAWIAHRLDKRIRRNSYRLQKMCPELARETARRHMAEKRHGSVKTVDIRRVQFMNDLLRG
jgi:cytidylate kinase